MEEYDRKQEAEECCQIVEEKVNCCIKSIHLPECSSCKTALTGSWNMTAAGAQYEKTGRYLGVNGYFLYGENPNWVYCYCKPCWQRQVLSLSFVPQSEQTKTLQQQLNTLQQQNTSLQQQLTTSQKNQNDLQQQLTASQQNQKNLQQQLNTSQEQLSSARSEAASHKKQFDEMSEKYEKLSNTSGIEKLRDLFKQLTSSQIDILHAHTNFRVDTFEKAHGEQQLQCSTLFIQSILTQFKSSVDKVIQLQQNTLSQTKQATESVVRTLKTAGMTQTIIDASTKPLEIEIKQIEVGIEGWNAFSAVLAGVVNQAVPAFVQEKASELRETYASEILQC